MRLSATPGDADIAAHNHDFGTGFQFSQHLALLVSGIVAAVQDHPAGSAVHQPSGDDQAETAETTRDDVRRARADHRMAFAHIETGARQPFDESAFTAPRDHIIVAGVMPVPRPVRRVRSCVISRSSRVVRRSGCSKREDPHQTLQGGRRRRPGSSS